MRLIVKNFGPLKDVDIEIKDIMVFIGPQSSGKSTLAKILAVFKDELSSEDSMLNELKNYNAHFFNETTYINYSNNYIVCNGNQITFSETYNENQKNIKSEIDKLKNNKAKEFVKGYFEIASKKYILGHTYIPAERIFFSTFSNSLMSIISNDIPIPRYLLYFGKELEQARQDIQHINVNADISSLNIEYEFKNGIDTLYLQDGQQIALDKVSSGLQTLIPLYLVLKKGAIKYKDINSKCLILIEEPELSLFPETQKQLIEFIFNMRLENNLVITTHSPYVLTAINNLIQAGNVVKQKPHLKKQVNDIINDNQWIEFDTIGVYYIADGTAKDILDYEYQLIGSHFIDEIAEGMDMEFEQLLELKYDTV